MVSPGILSISVSDLKDPYLPSAIKSSLKNLNRVEKFPRLYHAVKGLQHLSISGVALLRPSDFHVLWKICGIIFHKLLTILELYLFY